MAAPNQNDAQVDAEVEPTECSICLSNPSDHIIIPCGHQCGCKECLTQLKQSGGKCPMCRGRINIVQKVYASHNVRIKQKPAEQKNDENAWPEDVEDDEEEEEKKEEALDDSTEAVTIRIAPACVERKQNEDIYNVVLELVGSEKRGRCPVDVCAVLDTSGSMCSSAAVQEDDGSVSNDDGLSRLDCVKHSVKAVMNCLSKKDRFSIVSFESKAKLVYKLSYMDKTGIKHATNALEKLQPAGQTNLWEGLRQGLESLRTNRDTTGKRLSVIMLLTDGCPTMIPPKGELHELTNYMDQHNFSVQINTFGFGYDLDSELMHSLSMAGHGTFAFIPDARIVGTTFVNSVSNVLTTIFPMTKLSLTAMNGSKFVGPSYGAYTEQDESWGRAINIGPIMGGAARYLSIPMSVPKNEQPYLEAQLSTTENKVIKTVQATQRNIAGDLLAGHLTAKVVTVGFQATDLAKGRKGNAAIKLLAGLKKEVREAADVASKMETDNFDQMTANSRLEALNKDVQGRLAKAFNGEARFNRWGKHYLRALLRAHQLVESTIVSANQINANHCESWLLCVIFATNQHRICAQISWTLACRLMVAIYSDLCGLKETRCSLIYHRRNQVDVVEALAIITKLRHRTLHRKQSLSQHHAGHPHLNRICRVIMQEHPVAALRRTVV